MKSSLVLLCSGVAVFWAVASGLGYLLLDERSRALAYSATAAGLCLVPSALTLAWALWGTDKDPEQQRLAVLGGTGVRMFFVLGAALLLYSTVPFFERRGFWLWILVFYLFTLALEMVIVVRRQTLATPPQPGEPRTPVP